MFLVRVALWVSTQYKLGQVDAVLAVLCSREGCVSCELVRAMVAYLRSVDRDAGSLSE